MRILSLMLSCLAALGCSEDWQAETYPATGRVTINGEFPEGALVHLYPTEEKVDVRNSRPWGKVEEDGTFTLSTYESADGAPAGEYRVTLVWPVDPTVPAPTDRLGFRYSRPDQSQWNVTIEEGENLLPPIELTGAKVQTDRRALSVQGPPLPGGAQNSRRSGS